MIKIYDELIQGSDEWKAARCGLLTASEMSLIITPSNLKPANNDKVRSHAYELAAQRVNQYVEPSYIGDNMLRGWDDEDKAKALYSQHYGVITDVGFITNDEWGFTVGYSPDGLVGDDGLVECKSRKQYLQFQTISNDTVPSEHVIQLQTGLLVSGREWIDYISYCGGMPMFVKRVLPDPEIQEAIVLAATAFEVKVAEIISSYKTNSEGLIPTERTIIEEEIIA